MSALRDMLAAERVRRRGTTVSITPTAEQASAGLVGSVQNPSPDVGEPADQGDAPTPTQVRAARAKVDNARADQGAARVQAAMATLHVVEDQHGVFRLLGKQQSGRVDPVPVDSTAATDFVSDLLSRASGKRTPKTVAEDALVSLRAKARAERHRCTVYTRIAPTEDEAVLLDLAREDGAVVRVDAFGYRVQPQGETLFLRGAGCGEIPEPEHMTPEHGAGVLEAEFSDWGIPRDDWPVLLVLLPEWIRPRTPKPILQIIGTAGSGKTTVAQQIASVVDPARDGSLPAVRFTDADLIAAVQSRHVLHADNLSRLTQDEQDTLCKVATGHRIEHRKLYEQHSTIGADLLNPVVLTAITSVVGRSDARSRTITLAMKAHDSGYRSAIDLRQRFSSRHPALIGAVCALLSAGVAGVPAVKAQQRFSHRLVDFLQLGEAIHQRLGKSVGWFVDLMETRRTRDAAQLVEDDVVLASVMRVLQTAQARAVMSSAPPAASKWVPGSGTTVWRDSSGRMFAAWTLGKLLGEIAQANAPTTLFGTAWNAGDRVPTSERALRHALTHRAPTLGALGWHLTFKPAHGRSTVVFACAGEAQAVGDAR